MCPRSAKVHTLGFMPRIISSQTDINHEFMCISSIAFEKQFRQAKVAWLTESGAKSDTFRVLLSQLVRAQSSLDKGRIFHFNRAHIT